MLRSSFLPRRHVAGGPIARSARPLASVLVALLARAAIAQTPPAQTPPGQAPPAQTSPAQTSPAQAPELAPVQTPEPTPEPEPAPPVDDKAACITAFDQAQRDRAEARLVEAEKQLIACSRAECGTALMSECTQMYSDIERALPSVVLSAHDEAANVDLTTVQVSVNGQPLLTSIDARPIPLNPGRYEFEFSAAGHAPVKKAVVIGTGEKYRQVRVVFPAPPSAGRGAAAPLSAPVAPVAPSLVEPSHPVPVLTWVLGGVGVAALGTGAVLRVVGSGDYDSLKEECGVTGCPVSDVDRVERKYVLSNVAFGVGAAAAAAAVLWYVFDAPAGESTTLGIVPAASGDGAVAAALGTF